MHKSISLLVLFNSYCYAGTAIFAGGCFWCMEADFQKISGVTAVVSGYDGGKALNPNYKKVSRGKTNYIESIKVTYDDKKKTYKQLLNHYWQNIDPFDKNGQFCDKGNQYKSALFYLNNTQKMQAIESQNKLIKKIGSVTTQIRPSTKFYNAENYHQNYSTKNPLRYKFYRYSCGRDKRLGQLWKK